LATVAVKMPLANPQVALVVENVSDGTVAAVMTVDCESVQPVASVVVTVYVPAPSPVSCNPVDPLSHK
jgi:hypothetical protein